MSERTTTRIRKGTILDGRFELLDPLGEGGFATVYRGRQLNIDRTVAIKVLDVNPRIPDEELGNYRKRFVLEAKRAANIDHPDIVSIYDHGVMGTEQPYIVMELLQGHDLGEELARHGPMAPERILPLFVRCLDALQAAHAQGIVHKDLKPSNLFLTGVGTLVETLRIVDFGIAGLVDPKQDERMTSTGQYIGTALYCAPEYYEHSIVSPALDVYQMGLILAEVLIGRPAVNASSPVRAIMHHLAGALSLPEALRESPLGPLIAKATDLDHTQRYQSAGEFRDALSRLDPSTIGDVQQPERSLAEMETGTLSTSIAPDMLKTPPRASNTTPPAFAETLVAPRQAQAPPETPPPSPLEEIATGPAAPRASKAPRSVVLAGVALLLVSVVVGAGLMVSFLDSEGIAPTMEKSHPPPRGHSVSQPPPPDPDPARGEGRGRRPHREARADPQRGRAGPHRGRQRGGRAGVGRAEDHPEGGQGRGADQRGRAR